MTEKIPAPLSDRLIEKLTEATPKFKRDSARTFKFYDDKINQLFVVFAESWTSYDEINGESVGATSGINYYLRIYNGPKNNENPIFEIEGKEVKKLYESIINSLERLYINEEKTKKQQALKNLEDFTEN